MPMVIYSGHFSRDVHLHRRLLENLQASVLARRGDGGGTRDATAMGRYLISISGSSADDDGDVSHPPAAGRPLSYLRGMIRRDSSPSRVAAAEHHQRTAAPNHFLTPSLQRRHTYTHRVSRGRQYTS